MLLVEHYVIRQLIILCSFSSPDNSLPRTAELDPAQAGSVLWPIFRVTSLPKASTSTAFIYQCVCVMPQSPLMTMHSIREQYLEVHSANSR